MTKKGHVRSEAERQSAKAWRERNKEKLREQKRAWNAANRERAKTWPSAIFRKESVARRSWSEMQRRCNDPGRHNFRWYGGKGIKVCLRWLGPNGFKNFLKDMGEPAPGMTIDRIDGDGDYCPENCRWVTQTENNLTRRKPSNSRLVTVNGETLTVRGWAKRLGVNPQTLHARIQLRWPLERAVTEPLQAQFSHRSLSKAQRPVAPTSG